eukprot:Gb_30232 [translate_table: standard]
MHVVHSVEFTAKSIFCISVARRLKSRWWLANCSPNSSAMAIGRVLPTHKKENESLELEKLSPRGLARQSSAEWVEGGTDGLIGLSTGGLGLCPMQAAWITFYILFSLFVNSFVIIFVVTVWLAALDFWVVKNVSGRILVGLRWWNEINEQGESIWKFESLDQQSLARMSKKDSWLF